MKRVWRSRILAIATATVTASALAACSAGNVSIDASKLVSALPAAKGDVSVVRWNVNGEPDTLDPRNAVNYGSGQIVRNMCEALLKFDPDFNVSPNLASSYKLVSPTELQLNIRSGVKFWDGAPLTAADVVYSLERSAAPDSVISYAFSLVKAIKTTGPMQVTITFTSPDATFLDDLATIGGVVIEKSWGERTGSQIGTSSGGLMCTGPYKFASWRSGSSITIDRNDGYWNPQVRPFAQQVVFSFIADDTALAQALNAGEIDGTYELPVATIASLAKSKVGRVIFGPSTQSTTLNVAHPGGPLADTKLLDALKRAFDRTAIAKAIFSGSAEPSYTELTPATWPNVERAIYQPDYDKWASARSYDLAAARQLVKESSYRGQTLVLAIAAGDQTAAKVAQYAQQQAQAIGVSLRIDEMQPLVFAQASYDPTKRQGVDLMYGFNFNSHQAPLEQLDFDLIPGQAYNYINFNVPEVTRLLTEARETFDKKKQAQLIVEAQRLYEPTDGTISLLSNNEVTFLNNRLTGAVTSFAYWSMPQMVYIGAAK